LAARRLLAKIFRATPHASAAIHVRVSSARSAAAEETVAATIAAVAPIVGVAGQTAVVDVPIAEAAHREARVSSAVAPAAPGTIAGITAAIPAHRAVRS
jgi:hypothetical protein